MPDTLDEWIRYVIIPGVGAAAFTGLVFLTVQLFRDLKRKHRIYGGWNW